MDPLALLASLKGPKTSEFWLTGVALPIVGLGLMIFAALKITDPAMQSDVLRFGAMLVGSGPVGYAVSRGLAKGGSIATTISGYLPNQPAPTMQPGGNASGQVPTAPLPPPASPTDAAKTIANL